jgi:hypothetical protein
MMADNIPKYTTANTEIHLEYFPKYSSNTNQNTFKYKSKYALMHQHHIMPMMTLTRVCAAVCFVQVFHH